MSNVLIISDLHTPYHHPQAFEFIQDAYNRFKCVEVVCIGDEWDAHGVSRYVAHPDAMSPGDELTAARVALIPFFAAFPRVMVCESNHTMRPWKRAMEAKIPTNCLRGPREIFGAPRGWRWQHGWDFDGVRYMHGEGFSGETAALKAAKQHMTSVVIGHVHCGGGVQWVATPDKMIFGMNVGCLIDDKALAFQYAKNYARRPTLGCGVVVDGEPHFVPMR